MRSKLKIILLVIIMMLFTIKPIYAHAANKKYMWIKSNTHIKAKPKRKSKDIGIIYTYEKVKRINETGKWTLCKYKNKIGYIQTKYLTYSLPKFSMKKCPDNNFKAYMDFRCITNKSSKQYKLQQKAYTTKEGIRKIDNRYCIALGSYYSSKIGTKIDLITYDNKVIKCILADQKADKDTINNHMQARDGSFLEIIVDTKILPKTAKLMGDVSYTKAFNYKIKKIKVYK